MIYESYLYHHGIKGQKWGKQNGPPYPLDRQKNKIEKKYSKYINKTNKSAQRNAGMVLLKANLETSNKTGPINEHDTKEWTNFNKTYEKIANQRMGEFIENNKNYKKAVSLAKKYDMYSWSDLAKSDLNTINKYRNGQMIKVKY